MIFRAAVKGVVLYAVNRTLCSVYSEMLKVMRTSRKNRLIYREWDKSLERWRGGGLCRRWVVSMLLIIVSPAWSTGLCLITTTLWLLGAQQDGLKFRKKKKPLSKNPLFLENINNSFPPCSHLSCFLGIHRFFDSINLSFCLSPTPSFSLVYCEFFRRYSFCAGTRKDQRWAHK